MQHLTNKICGLDICVSNRAPRRCSIARPVVLWLGILSAFAAWSLFAPAPASAQAKAARTPTFQAPLEVMKTKHIAVQVRINGAGPFRLILDTGAPVTFISGRAAQQLKLISKAQSQRRVFMGMRGQTVLKTVAIGQARIPNLNAMILDHPIIGLLSQIDGPIDGIIGFSFFARFRTVIDYQAERVSFTPIAYQPQDVTASLFERMMGGEMAAPAIAPPGLWGMTVREPTAAEQKSNAASGVVVARVFAGGAAQLGGLRAGDRVTAIDGRWIESVTDCYRRAALIEPGQLAAIAVMRAGKFLTLQIRPRTGL